MIYNGVVKFYMKSRGFGFAYKLDQNGRRTKETIYFHCSNACLVDADGPEPAFKERSKRSRKTRSSSRPPLPQPKEDDMIVFEEGYGDGGRPEATTWAFERHWRAAEDAIARKKRRTSSPRLDPHPVGTA